MPDLLPITLEDMVRECDEELHHRRQVFPRLKAGASLARQNALERRVDVMKAIRARLSRELEQERDRASDQPRA